MAPGSDKRESLAHSPINASSSTRGKAVTAADMKWNLAISLIVCLAASVCSAGLDDFFHIPDRVKCKEVLVVIGRGTSEPPGEGPQRIFGKELQRRLGEDRVDHIPLDWPASLFPTYGESVRLGTEAVKRTVARYVDSCPHIKIVLMGFSQVCRSTMKNRSTSGTSANMQSPIE